MKIDAKIYVLLIVVLCFPGARVAFAVPVAGFGYSVELYASGIGAVTDVTIGADGAIYTADYGGGRILRIDGQDSVSVLSTGLDYITGLATTDDGRFFASASGGSSGTIYEIFDDGSYSTFASGFSFPTSLESNGNDLFISNSGDGTISKVSSTGSVSTFISGLSAPGGAFGISFDDSGMMYFVDHATGGIYSADASGNMTYIDSIASLGGTFTGIGFDDTLFVSDVNTGELFNLVDGNFEVFASGFVGKVNPPAIGPNDFIFDGTYLFAGDGDNLWKISAVSVPEPVTLALMLIGIVAIRIASCDRSQCHKKIQ